MDRYWFIVHLIPTCLTLSCSVANPHYKGMIDCFRKSYREGGVPIFFRGLLPTLSRAIIVNGPIFYIYEYTLNFMDSLESEDL